VPLPLQGPGIGIWKEVLEQGGDLECASTVAGPSAAEVMMMTVPQLLIALLNICVLKACQEIMCLQHTAAMNANLQAHSEGCVWTCRRWADTIDTAAAFRHCLMEVVWFEKVGKVSAMPVLQCCPQESSRQCCGCRQCCGFSACQHLHVMTFTRASLYLCHVAGRLYQHTHCWQTC